VDARVGQRVEELETPVVLVDLDRMEANIARWQRLADASGVAFRPHVKTHKIPAIAAKQLEAGAVGIACAKVAEAEVFVDSGIEDVVVAYPVVGPEKWRRLAELARRARITVNVESEVAARGLSSAAAAARATIAVQVEIDTGMHRCGFDSADVDSIVRFCATIESLPGVVLEGITTHRNVFFPGGESTPPEKAGFEEGTLLVELAGAIRSAGFDVREVTGGGSISGAGFAAAPGTTELRAGTYVFCDLMQLGFGVAGWADLALTVLSTVVSVHGGRRLTVDGGTKTFSGDRGVTDHWTSELVGLVAKAVDRDVQLDWLTEEHGMGVVGDDSVMVGDKLRFYPAHACTAVNLADELVGMRGGLVELVWPVLARGKRM